MTAPTTPKLGTVVGAQATLAKHTTPVVPSTWQTASGSLVDGAYTIQWAPAADKSGQGDVLWEMEVDFPMPSFPGIPGLPPIKQMLAQQLNFTWNSLGVVTGTSTNPSEVPSTPNTAPSLLAQIGNILSSIGAIFTAEFWKRAGEIVLGIILLIIGFVVLLRMRDQSNQTPATGSTGARIAGTRRAS